LGPDRLMYGSDWPNSDPLGTYAQVLQTVQEYFHVKGTVAGPCECPVGAAASQAA
jgi:hypothetical protein